MKWYWVMTGDSGVEDAFLADSASLNHYEGSAFWQAKRIEGWDPSAAFVSALKPENDGMPTDVLGNHLGVPIYSARLRDTLDRAAIGGIQYLPLQVLRPDNTELPGFAIANVLTTIEALDRDRSDFTIYPDDYFLPDRRGEIRAIRQPVLRHAVVKHLHVFRLAEFRASLYVSETFRAAFDAARCTGYGFVEVPLSYSA